MTYEEEHELKRRIAANQISKEEAIAVMEAGGVPRDIARKRVSLLRGERDPWELPLDQEGGL